MTAGLKDQETEEMTHGSGRISVVTGGSRGLGRSTVINLARRGVNTIFTYNSRADEAEKVVAEVQASGARAIAIQLDIGDTGGFDAFVAKLVSALGEMGADRFDYLVNNAGISHHQLLIATSEDELDTLYRVNFKGPFFLTQKLLPLLNDGGRIINVSTGLTRFSADASGPYASLKGAIEVFTRYLAKELGPRGITANSVAPGAVMTDFSGGVVRDNPVVNKMISDMTPLGRPGMPEDIGPMIASLLSDDNRWVNAQRIEVSGGTFIGPIIPQLAH